MVQSLNFTSSSEVDPNAAAQIAESYYGFDGDADDECSESLVPSAPAVHIAKPKVIEIFHRYSEFRQLFQILKKTYPEVVSLWPLEDKFKPQLLEQRRASLEAFCQAVCMCPEMITLTYVLQFFGGLPASIRPATALHGTTDSCPHRLEIIAGTQSFDFFLRHIFRAALVHSANPKEAKPKSDMSGFNTISQIPGNNPRPLADSWTMYYSERQSSRQTGFNKIKPNNYESNIKPLGSFSTAESFWELYSCLARPGDLNEKIAEYHMFLEGVRPVWEDPANANGGKWTLRMRKGLASRFWENLLLAIVGNQFPDKNEICGAVMSIRYNEDILSLWTRNADNTDAQIEVARVMKQVLHLKDGDNIDYKNHSHMLRHNIGNPSHSVIRPSYPQDQVAARFHRQPKVGDVISRGVHAW
eukprot:UC4_evm4s1369